MVGKKIRSRKVGRQVAFLAVDEVESAASRESVLRNGSVDLNVVMVVGKRLAKK